MHGDAHADCKLQPQSAASSEACQVSAESEGAQKQRETHGVGVSRLRSMQEAPGSIHGVSALSVRVNLWPLANILLSTRPAEPDIAIQQGGKEVVALVSVAAFLACSIEQDRGPVLQMPA